MNLPKIYIDAILNSDWKEALPFREVKQTKYIDGDRDCALDVEEVIFENDRGERLILRKREENED